jgi:uncharacterized protein YxjI
MTDTQGVDDLFNSPTISIEQPGKLLATQAEYKILDARRQLLAVAEETDHRTRGQVLKAALPIAPPPGAQVLLVHTEEQTPLLVLQKLDGGRVSEVRLPDGRLVGTIRAERTTRHYALLDGEGARLGTITGDLSLRRFTLTDASNISLGHVTKKWAGLAKELLTTADKYSLEISANAGSGLRVLFVMSAIVLDLTLHENLGGR